MTDRDKPSEREIASYLKWLENPEGDAHLQTDLPLHGGKVAEAAPDRPDQIMLNNPAHGASRGEKSDLTASQAVSRIRCLAVAGLSIRDISIRTGMHEKYVETVIHSPGQLNRRYE